VIASSIMGVGASRRVSAVRWGVARSMIIAWILTIPVAAMVAALLYLALRIFF
jgi:inorganic phosphate transporter, PiT family